MSTKQAQDGSYVVSEYVEGVPITVHLQSDPVGTVKDNLVKVEAAIKSRSGNLIDVIAWISALWDNLDQLATLGISDHPPSRPLSVASWSTAADATEIVRVWLAKMQNPLLPNITKHLQRANTSIDLPLLTDSQQAVYDVLAGLPDDKKGLTGQEICRTLRDEKGYDISQSTLTSHIIPKLKHHGVTNKRGVGYFISKSNST